MSSTSVSLHQLIEAGLDIVDDTLSRALYTSDAGLYRAVPQAVAYPRDADEVRQLVTYARATGTPLTARGSGTSCAGNAIGTGIVVDVKRHQAAILDVDPMTRSATVQPGVVQGALQAAARPHGLLFGPDPSTSDRCTVGGMIGNNACGPRALGYGRSADNVLELEVVTGTGEILTLGPDRPTDSPTLVALRHLVDENLALIRTEFGRFSRQVSGYSLEHLLPERRFDVAKFLAGTEGTLAVTTRARVRLVHAAGYKTMVVLGYPTMPEAADDAPLVAKAGATAVEGLDRRIVEVVVRRHGPEAVPALPAGNAWIMVELVDDDEGRLAGRAHALLESADAQAGWVVEDDTDAAALWKIRADGAGLAETSLDRPAYGGWEDAAVPPEWLGDYLRAFEQLLTDHELHALPYGHFGEGCVHCRIDFPLDVPGGAEAYAAFVDDAARLVGRFGGSLSGEHGDGRARSALLGHMYSPAALDLMKRVKKLFDPDGVLNPGVLVDPADVSDSLRVPLSRQAPLARTHLPFVEAVHRCSGVGKCLVDGTASGKVMCPSYQATGQERDSTRGRARVLQELANGEMVSGWDSPDVADALDLCLSCKGCSRDCPTGTDMATLKSIVTEQRYRGRLRPRSHYTLGWLPRWGRLVTGLRLGQLVNLAARLPGICHILRWTAGIDQRRGIPLFAPLSNRRQLAQATTRRDESGVPIAIWVDSFSDCFEDGRADHLLAVLSAAGYAPTVIGKAACCGLTWISTGQREAARRQMAAALDTLAPVAASGILIVGLEPSCLATWRSDAVDLVGDDPRTASVVTAMRTLAEALLVAPAWEAPDLSDVVVVAQPHCHHSSVLGWAADAEVLQRTGARVTTLGGCCGLAGNFGVEAGHYEISVAVASHDLLPAVAAAPPEAQILADGFSCRLQLQELAGRPSVSLGELLLKGDTAGIQGTAARIGDI